MLILLEKINGFVWGVPALVLILGIGLYLTVGTGFAQLRLLPDAVSAFIKQFKTKEKKSGEISPYQALCTALAATVGTGNIAGVAGAIALGGPGAIFWMWICALLGMITKFAEATLAVHFRVKNVDGEYVGGTMYMIQQGLSIKWSWLSVIYCFFGVVASFGVGNVTQINAVIGGMNSMIHAFGGQESKTLNLLIGVALAVLLASILLGGAKRIGQLAERIVPVAAVAYILLCVTVLILRASAIPEAFSLIINGAFSPRAATGGALGSAFIALRVGASRGVFTNEAGMGTASIAHAAANVEHPVQQGLMGIIEVFLDTILICTMTALVIICSGIDIPYGYDTGAQLTIRAFNAVYGDWVSILITLALCAFAIATVLGWGLYGARCAQYLFGDHAWKIFVYIQTVAVVLGSVLGTGTVWLIAEIVNGLMAIPNLICLALLSPELFRMQKDYRRIRASVKLGSRL